MHKDSLSIVPTPTSVSRGGFISFELLAVLFIAVVLAFTFITRIIELYKDAQPITAQAKLAEMTNYLTQAVAKYTLTHNKLPTTGHELLSYLNSISEVICPPTASVIGDFEVRCVGDIATRSITLQVLRFRGVPLENVTIVYTF